MKRKKNATWRQVQRRIDELEKEWFSACLNGAAKILGDVEVESFNISCDQLRAEFSLLETTPELTFEEPDEIRSKAPCANLGNLWFDRDVPQEMISERIARSYDARRHIITLLRGREMYEKALKTSDREKGAFETLSAVLWALGRLLDEGPWQEPEVFSEPFERFVPGGSENLISFIITPGADEVAEDHGVQFEVAVRHPSECEAVHQEIERGLLPEPCRLMCFSKRGWHREVVEQIKQGWRPLKDEACTN